MYLVESLVLLLILFYLKINGEEYKCDPNGPNPWFCPAKEILDEDVDFISSLLNPSKFEKESEIISNISEQNKTKEFYQEQFDWHKHLMRIFYQKVVSNPKFNLSFNRIVYFQLNLNEEFMKNLQEYGYNDSSETNLNFWLDNYIINNFIPHIQINSSTTEIPKLINWSNDYLMFIPVLILLVLLPLKFRFGIFTIFIIIAFIQRYYIAHKAMQSSFVVDSANIPSYCNNKGELNWFQHWYYNTEVKCRISLEKLINKPGIHDVPMLQVVSIMFTDLFHGILQVTELLIKTYEVIQIKFSFFTAPVVFIGLIVILVVLVKFSIMQIYDMITNQSKIESRQLSLLHKIEQKLQNNSNNNFMNENISAPTYNETYEMKVLKQLESYLDRPLNNRNNNTKILQRSSSYDRLNSIRFKK